MAIGSGIGWDACRTVIAIYGAHERCAIPDLGVVSREESCQFLSIATGRPKLGRLAPGAGPFTPR